MPSFIWHPINNNSYYDSWIIVFPKNNFVIMSKNRDLLKEAIADAKSVKETAIANAKLALEEAFTPHLKSMMSAKLQEMDEDDMDDVKKEEMKAKSKEGKVDEEINLDELLAELDSEEVKENKRTDAEEEGYKDGMRDEKKDLQKEDARTDAEEEGYEDGMKDEKEDMDDNMDDMEIDLDDLSEDDLKNYIESVIKDMVEAGELEPGDEFADNEVDVEDAEDIDDVEDVMDVDVEIDEAKEDIDEEKEYMTKKEKAEGDDRKNDNKAETETEKMRKMKEDLTIALDEVNSLKTELNEVNLLNAKLLYTNKIFKSKNLTEDKKVKVLKAFDNAKDVKHAKTIFETLNEGLLDNKSNNSRISEIRKGSASKATGKAPVTKKQPIVESDVMVARFKKLAGII